ncbi:MAG: hypothetical protein A2X18_01505 [Bacteroidetes bacterium GWF2_40_14]|nr:MAG: hypothetical protein A2X18_01505 [Bacteroidetes bacterium GWF2_40_14]
MKNYKFEIKWASIFILMSLLWMVLERIAGLHDKHIDVHMIYTNFMAIPAIAVYVFALLDKKKNFYSGKMTYFQGFLSGIIITLIVTIVSPLTQLITSLIITPHFFENAIRYTTEHGKMSMEEAVKYFSLNNYIMQGFIGALLMGLITAAAVALFTRSKR